MLIFLNGCSTKNNDKDFYVISSERNDIKDKEPELWSWIEAQSRKAQSKKEKAKTLYPEQLTYAQNLIKDPIQNQKRQLIQGVWIDCNGLGLGDVYKFMVDGRFYNFQKKFNDNNCKTGAKPGLAGFGFEFIGFYLVGKILSHEGIGKIYELDLIHTDSPRTKTYDESRVYYKVANIDGNKLLFNSRTNRSIYLPPKNRNTRLDKKEYTYLKCNCEITAE